MNELPLRLQQEGIPLVHAAETFFEYSVEHLLSAWGILLAFAFGFLIISRVVLGGIGKENV